MKTHYITLDTMGGNWFRSCWRHDGGDDVISSLRESMECIPTRSFVPPGLLLLILIPVRAETEHYVICYVHCSGLHISTSRIELVLSGSGDSIPLVTCQSPWKLARLIGVRWSNSGLMYYYCSLQYMYIHTKRNTRASASSIAASLGQLVADDLTDSQMPQTDHHTQLRTPQDICRHQIIR